MPLGENEMPLRYSECGFAALQSKDFSLSSGLLSSGQYHLPPGATHCASPAAGVSLPVVASRLKTAIESFWSDTV